jgi:hypothetical protein
MQFRSAWGARLIAGALCGALLAGPAVADSPAVAAGHDGQHDFDFDFGVWHTHIRRVLDPFSPGSEAIELNGTVSVRKVWGGRASLEEIEVDGPKGHWEAMTLFLYNPSAQQWSMNFINARIGELNSPLIGSFHDGRAELIATDTFQGRPILVRGIWSEILPDSHRYQELYSADGGKTWAASFDAHLTREHP